MPQYGEMRRLLPLVLTLAALPAFASLGLTLKVDKQPDTYLALGGTWLRYEHDGEVTIRDFATRRVFTTNAKGTIEKSLFAEVTHELSDTNKLLIADFSISSIETTDAERAEFIRFVRYTFNARPGILLDLLNRHGIPRELRTFEHHIVITNAMHFPDAPYPPIMNPHLTIESNAMFGDAAVKALEGVPPAVEVKLAADAVAFMNANDNLDALLTLVAYEMTTSKPLPAAVMERARAVIADPKLRAMQLAARARPPENGAALATLAHVHDQTTVADDVVSILEADVMNNGGVTGDKVALHLRDPLSNQPWIAGAWKILGDAFFNSRSQVEAWDAWTIARRLDPKYASLMWVDVRERTFVLLHPEFF
jgi:hypothetical protein